MTRSPCGLHLHPRPVDRCVYCGAAMAELIAWQPERNAYSRAGMSERVTEARRRGREKQRASGRGIDAANTLSVVRHRAWERDDAGVSR